MSNFKSTGNAKSKASKYVDRNLTDIISEIDSSLNEAEKEKKKTIVFNLAKMEYVVHNDPDLSEFYNKMVEENKDLYGYHYNEAIMNIIFNVKVLKNDKYLRMYKNAPVKKKKRRDKYGAEDLKTPSTKRREKLEKEREKRKEKKKMQNETTSASGSGAYASPYAWAGGSKPMRREPIWKGGVVIQEGDETLLEHHLNTKEEKIEFIINNVGDKYGSEEELFDLTDNALDVVYLNVEKEMGIDDISPEDLEDIDIEEVEVDDLDESSKDKQRYKNMLKDLQGDDYDLDDIDDELLDTLSTKKEKFKKKEINNESFADLNEEDDKREMIVATDKNIKDEFKPNFNEHTLIEEVNEDERLDESSKDKQRYKNLLKGLQGNDYELDDIEDKLDKYNNKNKKKSKKSEKELVDEASIIEPSDNTISMSRDEDDSMKMTKPLTTSTVSGIDEDEELLKSHKEFISEIAVKRHPSMIRVDRVKNQNKNNFKQGIDRINDIQTAQEEITTVDEPQKYSDDIEKEVLKRTKGQSFKNVGNSANEKGDEIPKGNITKDEEEELDTIRDGMHTLKYTREPDSRFEERMKRDMGDDMYDKRKRSLEAKKNMPMYIKDKQPISEDYSMLGVYNDKFGKDNFITIKPGNISLVNEEYVNENNYIRIKTEGLGNRVNNRFRLNESVDKLIESVDFYINESNGYIVGIEKSNSKGMINESVENTSKSIINESHLNKMRSLIDYRPSKYIDTVKSKSMID